MQRSDIQLRASALGGDALARCELGRRYLHGSASFPRNVPKALEYLTHESLTGNAAAATAICEGLRLEDFIDFGQLRLLEDAAHLGRPSAQFKLGIWRLVTRRSILSGKQMLLRSASLGDAGAALVLASLERTDGSRSLVLDELSRSGIVNLQAVALKAARACMQDGDRDGFNAALEAAAQLRIENREEFETLVVEAVKLSATDASGGELPALDTGLIEASLQARADAQELNAAYLLGTSLMGVRHWGAVGPRLSEVNLRRAVAILMRAAHAGEKRAWFDLYLLHSDRRSTVANAPLSRFFLEKAAELGKPHAQRILGASLLARMSNSRESERAIDWLHRAARQGDSCATRLLQTLVLPVAGDHGAAMKAVAVIGKSDPKLGFRLMLARCFGLTRHEALIVDPLGDARPWGVVVRRNPFIAHERVSAGRAVPALDRHALEFLASAATVFAGDAADHARREGNWRQRVSRLRKALCEAQVDECLFFAQGQSGTLDSYRSGPKWAFRCKELLVRALSAPRAGL